ncbi:hypothetical protein SDC9_104529 [bioreactor metagenome]|uniref:Glycosyltransferase 2-like domain-containing protein n=1 Tax=bioreactor metagenome TaxID=1076179 RepID=A0A645AY47_9ZZZZ
MRVSIIISSYNNLKYIFELLDSIFSQTYSNIEIIIADDGSEEFDQREIYNYINNNNSKNFNFKILHSEINQGTVKNINSALSVATGEIIKFIATDDLFFSTHTIENIVSHFKKEPFAFLVTRIQECDINMCPMPSKLAEFTFKEFNFLKEINNNERFRLHCIYGTKPPAPGFFFTKKCFEQYGFFDEAYRLAEDSPMWCRLLREGCPIAFYDCVTVKYRIGSGISTTVTSAPNEVLKRDQKLKVEKEIFPYMSIFKKSDKRKILYTYTINFLFENYSTTKKYKYIALNFDIFLKHIFKRLFCRVKRKFIIFFTIN